MSFSSASAGSGGNAARKAYEFGRTYVVRPKGKHQATVVWLHGLGDNGGSWSQILETLPLTNIKWICPTAPTRPISLFGGFPSTAWFDVQELSEDALDDEEGLDATVAHVVNLLSTEPTDIKLAVGGFSMGAASALHTAVCHVSRKYANGKEFPVNLSAVLGLSGWLPCAKSLNNKLAANEAPNRAASLPIMLCHGKGMKLVQKIFEVLDKIIDYLANPAEMVKILGSVRILDDIVNKMIPSPTPLLEIINPKHFVMAVDDVVKYKFGEKSWKALSSSGFGDVTFKSYAGLGHYTHPEEIQDICSWLKSKLNLDG